MWSLPTDWKLPENEECFLKFKEEGRLWSMSEPNWKILEPHLTNKRVVLDIGAHIGTTVLRYAKHFETVHAFEPMYYNILEQNTRQLDNVIIHPFAASNNDDTQYMHKSNTNSGCTVIKNELSKSALQESRFRGGKKIEINCITIDSLNLTNVDFVKMDTEGYVLPILQGMVETLKNSNYPIMMIEFNYINTNKRECMEFISNLGYEQFDIRDVDYFFRHKDHK